MNNDDFTKLFKYIQEFRTEVNSKLDEKANSKDMQTALNLLDSLAKRQEISDDERIVMSHQLTRLHDWVEEAAKRIDLKFVH